MKEEVIDQTPKRMYTAFAFDVTNETSAELKFETFGPHEVVKNGVVQLTNRDLYLITDTQSADRVPARHGALDLRLVFII